jgi:transcriptional regulator with XRE-family HTH domain
MVPELAYVMSDLGVTQNALERKAQFKSGRLSRFMNGRRVAVPLGFLAKLAAACGSNPSRMLSVPSDPKFQRFLALARRRHSTSGHRRLPAA